jgi:hypothetical protein
MMMMLMMLMMIMMMMMMMVVMMMTMMMMVIMIMVMPLRGGYDPAPCHSACLPACLPRSCHLAPPSPVLCYSLAGCSALFILAALLCSAY